MANRGHQLLHADAFAAELEALGLDSSIFGDAGIPAPVFANLIPRRAGVWDTLPNTFGFGDFSSAFTRASDALYRDGAGKWQTAGNGVIRPDHDANGNFLGMLFEPESVNQVSNYNANPDSGLTNLVKSGDAAATMSRVADVAALAAAGLDAVCHSGFVVKLDNSAGSTNALIQVQQALGNTNTHTISAFARNDASNPGACTIKISGVGGVSVQVTSDSYARYSDTGTPDAVGRVWEFVAPAGNIGYFILNQLEEQAVATSPIVTTGASATRALDALSWPLADWQSADFINDSAGMGAMIVSPTADATIRGNVNSRHILLGPGSSYPWISHGWGNQILSVHDGVNTVALNLAYSADDVILLVWRWSGTTMAINIKRAGSWVGWSTETYDGDWESLDSIKPASSYVMGWRLKNLFIWDQDEGNSFLENFFAGVAN